ncbi:hypothetical protein ACA910_012090 [Epithemia clementina (nom. ined.)]
MLEFVPLHLSVPERQAELSKLLMCTMHEFFPVKLLSPEGWFDDAFRPGNFLWTPPPAAALEALEQLCKSRQIRPLGAHIFACPALMSNCWQKKLGRVSDVIFTVPVGWNL